MAWHAVSWPALLMLLGTCMLQRRFVRLGTASLAAAGPGGPFIACERLDLRKYAARPNLARVLCDYILYVVSRSGSSLCSV